MTFISLILCLSSIVAVFSGQVLVPLLILIFLIAVIKTYSLEKVAAVDLFHRAFVSIEFKLLLLPIGFMFLSAFWSIDIANTFKDASKLFLLLLIGLVVFIFMKSDVIKSSKFIYMIAFGVIAASFVMLIDYNSHGFLSKIVRSYKAGYVYNLSDLNRGVVYLSFSVWSLIIVFFYQAKFFILATTVVTAIATVLLLDSLTATVGLCVALVVLLTCIIMKRLAIYVITLLMAVGVIITPFLAVNMNPVALANNELIHTGGSVKHRLFIWDFAAKKAIEKPLLGWGFDSSRAIEVTKEDKIPDCWGAQIITESMSDCVWTESTRPYILPLHPHNGTLQIWLELGALGLLIYITLIVYTGVKIARMEDSVSLERSVYFSLFVQFIVIQQTGFGMWQNWLWAAFILAIIQLKFISNYIKFNQRNAGVKL